MRLRFPLCPVSTIAPGMAQYCDVCRDCPRRKDVAVEVVDIGGRWDSFPLHRAVTQ